MDKKLKLILISLVVREAADYTGAMSQLTKQDVADVVEEVLDRKLDQKLDQKFEEKLGLKPGETLDQKLDEKLDRKLDEKFDQHLDSKLGAFVEHLDDKFDGLAEAVSLMNTNMGGLARRDDLEKVKDDVKTIRLAVTDTNGDLRRLGESF